ncbi:hypothetical protein F310043J5_29120 [Anaerostipes hominis (ex Lee et al. 2021)]
MPGLSNCDGIIKPGWSEQFIPEHKDPKKHTAFLPIKIVGYKNGKPVMASYYCMKLNGAH